MANGAQARRLSSLKRLLADVHARLQLEFGFVLWDGSTVPESYPNDRLAVVFADEGVIAALIRRPNLETLLNLWVAARIDLQNGTFFDLIERRPKIRTKEIRRKIDWKLALDAGWRFLFLSRGGPWPLESIPEDRPSSGSATENKQNVAYHYDVSNAFYALFLDSRMVYTCAYFTDWNNDLETAQRDKLELICRKLRLKQGETLLDIGCGWGALICYAAQHYGVRAYGVTLSEQQYAYARDQIARCGLGDRVRVELKDYAAVEGEFDKICQIEMVEHIGLANHPAFFQKVHRLLKPDGLYLHHATTRIAKGDDKAFLRKRPEVRAVTKYIFPGVEFDHIGMMLTDIERNGFEVHDVENLREHDGRTCRLCHDRLYANREAAAREAGSVTTRLWLAWLAGAAITFERNTGLLYQVLASKRRRGPSGLPPTRAELYR